MPDRQIRSFRIAIADRPELRSVDSISATPTKPIRRKAVSGRDWPLWSALPCKTLRGRKIA